MLGGFLLVTANLDRLGAEWGRAAELSVYLKDDISLEDRRAIEELLAPGDTVASHEYVSKADALVRFKQTFADLAGAIDTLGDNPLPASFDVRLRAGGGSATDDANGDSTQVGLETLVSRLRQMTGVADVRYDRQWLMRVLAAITHAHAHQHFRYQTVRRLVERTPAAATPALVTDDPAIRPMTQYTLEDFLR